MEATTDPTSLSQVPREAVGLAAGSEVDISAYGSSAQITPGGRTAALRRTAGGRLVARSEAVVTDDMLFALIELGRR